MGRAPGTSATHTRARVAPTALSRPPLKGVVSVWVRSWRLPGKWELWLALAVGGFLRLWHPGVSAFFADQAQLMALARASVLRGALPITGIPSSIGMLNPPLSIYALLPFTAFSADPLPVIMSLALWNTLGIWFCYAFAARAFGRWVAGISALLFATCGAAIDFSRFLWQQNYLPPLIALWALALFAACVHGARKWLVPCLLALVAAVQLHPTAALLLPATAVGIALAPAWPRRRDYAWLATGLILLLAPTVVWEVLSRWSDAAAVSRFATSHSSFDPSVFFRLYQLIGPPLSATSVPHRMASGLTSLAKLVLDAPGQTIFLPGAPYRALGFALAPLALAAAALCATGWVILTGHLAMATLSAWRPTAQDTVGGRLAGTWQAVRGDTAWRARILLWLWVTVPPATMLRHSNPIFVHYLLILYPGIFVVAALGAVWLLQLGRGRHAALDVVEDQRAAHNRIGPVQVAVAGALALLLLGQTAESTLCTASLATGLFSGQASFALPLGDLRAAEAALGPLQRRQGATSVWVLTEPWSNNALTYTLAGEHPDRATVDEGCLILPSAGNTLIVAPYLGVPSGRLLSALPNAAPVAEIPLGGESPLAIFRVSGATPTLRGEVALAPVIFRDGNGYVLELRAIAADGPDALRLRWTMLAATLPGQAPRQVRLTTGGLGIPTATGECQPTRWHAGDTVYTWVRSPGITSRTGTLVLGVQARVSEQEDIRLGPLRLLSSRVLSTPLTPLTPVMGGPAIQAGGVGVITAGGFEVPLDAVWRGAGS